MLSHGFVPCLQKPPASGKPESLGLMLTPDEVEKVLLAEEVGALRFSLRSLWEGETQVPLQGQSSELPWTVPSPAPAAR